MLSKFNYKNLNILTLEDLTPEIRAKIPEYLERDLDDLSKGGYYERFNYEAAVKAVNKIYKMAELDPPKLFVTENPFEMNLLFNYLGLYHELENYTTAHDEIMKDKLNFGAKEFNPMLDRDLELRLDEELFEKLSPRHKSLNSEIKSLLYEEFTGRSWKNFILINFKELCKGFNEHFNLSYLPKGDPSDIEGYNGLEKIYNLNESGLDIRYAFTYSTTVKYEFVRNEMEDPLLALSGRKRRYKGHRLSMYDLMRDAAIFRTICSKDYCVISKFPKRIHWDENFEFHNLHGAAIEWGYSTELSKWRSCHFIHGRLMPAKIFNGFTKEDFINMKNEDVRAGMYAIIESRGEGAMLDFLGAKKVHEQQFVHANGDIESMELYKTTEYFIEEEDLNGSCPAQLAWLKITCPSTGSLYLIPSDSAFDTCMEAAKYHRPDYVTKEVPYIWEQRS